MFSTWLYNFLTFSSNLKLSSANSLSLEESKICCLGKDKSGTSLYSLPNDNFLDWSKIKAFVNGKFNVACLL